MTASGPAASLKRGRIALSRFGYGPRGDGDVAIAASDPRGFLAAELAEPGIALLAGPALPTGGAALARLREEQAARKAERLAEPAKAVPDARPEPAATMASTPPAAGPAPGAPGVAAGAPAKPPPLQQIVYREEALARVRRAIEARAGFAERLVAFWSNHFCVSAAKGPLGRMTAGAFEREAIRPHVLGRFADMLAAVEQHPAMLQFLDNARSVGPGSRAGLRSGRGLNENLGREILELHTLGADGGYTQADVTGLARILTGWSIAGPRGPQGLEGDARGFVFRAAAHEPGPIALLGRSYPDTGLDQGRAALDDLARHPRTAHLVATRLARAFVADAPPPALVATLARVFRDTDGDLRAVSLALIAAPEAWDGPGKVRTPWELVVAIDRLLGHLPEEPGQVQNQVLGPLQAMGMGLWMPPGPNGHPSEDAAWASPEGMRLRLDYCAQVARRLKTPRDPGALLEALTGSAPSSETCQAVARAESREQGLALLLMSPEMQRS